MILILVMSARRQPWGQLMDAQMETWDAEDNPQTRTLYYVGKSEAPDSDKVFHSRYLGEDLEQVSARTIEAFEKSLELDWEYLARPHSSTYVHKRNLVAFCDTLPKTNVLCGIMTEGIDPFLWGGCHYLFSRDVIERMVFNKDLWYLTVMEDHSITRMAKYIEVPVTQGHSATIDILPDGYSCLVYGHGENFTFTDWNDVNKAQGHFFFRVKQDLRRHEDVRIMRELKAHLK